MAIASKANCWHNQRVFGRLMMEGPETPEPFMEGHGASFVEGPETPENVRHAGTVKRCPPWGSSTGWSQMMARGTPLDDMMSWTHIYNHIYIYILYTYILNKFKKHIIKVSRDMIAMKSNLSMAELWKLPKPELLLCSRPARCETWVRDGARWDVTR